MIVSQHLMNQKLMQLGTIGLSLNDLNSLSEIVCSSYASKPEPSHLETKGVYKYPSSSNIEGFVNFTDVPAYAVTYNISPDNLGQYNMIGFENALPEQLIGYSVPNPIYVMNNSFPSFLGNTQFSDAEVPESTNSSRKTTIASADEAKTGALPKTGMVSGAKIGLLRKVLEGIHDDYQILITSKPKNKSNKIRKSNRHSRYRGVSLNGKKWQVMIMGPIKKKYFGGISTEREAAVFYDKLSILTNGLAAKTNFNYRKCDLMKMMAELEYMETQVS